MGEHGDVAMTETDEMADGFIAAGFAIGADGVEAWAVAPRSRSTVGGSLAPSRLKDAIEASLAGRRSGRRCAAR